MSEYSGIVTKKEQDDVDAGIAEMLIVSQVKKLSDVRGILYTSGFILTMVIMLISKWFKHFIRGIYRIKISIVDKRY